MQTWESEFVICWCKPSHCTVHSSIWNRWNYLSRHTTLTDYKPVSPWVTHLHYKHYNEYTLYPDGLRLSRAALTPSFLFYSSHTHTSSPFEESKVSDSMCTYKYPTYLPTAKYAYRVTHGTRLKHNQDTIMPHIIMHTFFSTSWFSSVFFRRKIGLDTISRNTLRSFSLDEDTFFPV